MKRYLAISLGILSVVGVIVGVKIHDNRVLRVQQEQREEQREIAQAFADFEEWAADGRAYAAGARDFSNPKKKNLSRPYWVTSDGKVMYQ